MSKQVNDMLREEGASRYARLKRYPVQRNGVEIWARQREEKRRQMKERQLKWESAFVQADSEPHSETGSPLSGEAVKALRISSRTLGWGSPSDERMFA